MLTQIETDGDVVTARLTGELDHHSAPSAREKIDDHVIRLRPRKLILDFDGVTFMDSSGIGLIMGRYRLISSFPCALAIINLSGHAYKVMRLAGLDKLAALSRKKEAKNSENKTAE